MTQFPRKLVSHASYKHGVLTFGDLFAEMNPDFNWQAGDKVLLDYDEKKDTLTVKRVD